MKTPQSEKGSTLLVLCIILVCTIITAIGYVLWSQYQNPTAENTTNSSQIVNQSKSEPIKPEIEYETFATDSHGVSFQYPKEWKIEQTYSDDSYAYTRSYHVRIDNKTALGLTTGNQGLGGRCEEPQVQTNTVLESQLVDIQAKKPVYLSYIVQPQDDGTYMGVYGLTDYFTEAKEYTGCSNTFYMVFESTNKDLLLIGFNGSASFPTIQEAKDFIKTDKYKEIIKALKSLKYNS
jgi:hypothetical protein